MASTLRRLFSVCAVICMAQLAHAQAPAIVPEQLPDATEPAAEPAAQPPLDEMLYPELEPESGKYIVPPVVDRPLGDTEGPRIKVEAIDLRGAEDRPERGLLLDDVWKVIEEDRAIHPDGYYIGELQILSNKITDLYRSKGFIVAHAFIPVQTVEDGIVTVQVLEGVLGRILVEGNEKLEPASLARPFESMLGQPLVNNEVESALTRLTDYPGLTLFGVFQPGQQVGAADLVLKVQEEKPFDLVYSLDNHGSRFTGEYVSRVDMGINNVFGQVSRLDLAIQQSADPGLADLLSFGYSQELFQPRYRIEFGQEDDNFELDGRQTGVDGLAGETRTFYLRFRDSFERGRTKNAYWLLSVDRKTARSFQNESRLARDNLAVVTLEYGLDTLDAGTQSFSNFVVQWNHGENEFLGAMSSGDQKGSRRTGSGDFVTSRFDKFTLSYAYLASLSPRRSFFFRADAQYTDDPLLGLEQFTIGGAGSVRAYPVSEVTMDRGVFLSAEHIWNAPGFTDRSSPFDSRKWGEVFTVSTFFDWAHGERIDPLRVEETSSSLKGWGLGAQLAVPGSFTARVTAAWPILGSPIPANRRRPQVFLSFETEVF